MNNIKSLEEFLTEGVSDSELTVYNVYCRDQEGTLKELLEYIAKIGNTGHSFSIVVDPGDAEFEKKFGWDGDGADYIKKVETQ